MNTVSRMYVYETGAAQYYGTISKSEAFSYVSDGGTDAYSCLEPDSGQCCCNELQGKCQVSIIFENPRAIRFSTLTHG